MSVIAVKGIPNNWSLAQVAKLVHKSINGPFEVMNFLSVKKSVKICFLKLSAKVDPVRAVKAINALPPVKSVKMVAYIPDQVPDLPVPKKKRKILFKGRRFVVFEDEPPQVLIKSHTQLMTEIQIKYPGLFELSKMVDHALIEDISDVVHDRLKQIMVTNKVTLNVFKLTLFYRKRHPHFGDFQLILSTLHYLQDAAAVPRSQISEAELLPATTQFPMVDKFPAEKVRVACSKYSDRIVKKVTAHVENLVTEVTDMDSEETIARKKVRLELQKLSPYLSPIIRQIIRKHFVPDQNETYRVKIYGEPYLPSKASVMSALSCCHPTRVTRSRWMYNLMVLRVRPIHFPVLFKLDGTIVNAAKLVIRSIDVPIYKTSATLEQKMVAQGVKVPPTTEHEEMDEDNDAENDYEDWN